MIYLCNNRLSSTTAHAIERFIARRKLKMRFSSTVIQNCLPKFDKDLPEDLVCTIRVLQFVISLLGQVVKPSPQNIVELPTKRKTFYIFANKE